MLVTTAAAAGPITLGAYRGLLFCKRPPPGGARPPPRIAAPPDPYGIFHGSWTVEVVHPCGRNTSLSALDTVRAPASRPTATAAAATDAVKAFLLSLALRRRELKSAEASESLRVSAKRARVAAQAAQLRALIRGGAGRKDSGGAAAAEADAVAVESYGNESDAASSSSAAPAPAAVAPSLTLSLASLHARPVWARSETVQAAVDDAHAAELIRFARGLNADVYFTDLEDCAGVALARAQLAALENAASGARAALAAAEAAAEGDGGTGTVTRGGGGPARGPSPDGFGDAVAPMPSAGPGVVPASIPEGSIEDVEKEDAPAAGAGGVVSALAKTISAAHGGANDGSGEFAVGGFWAQKN